MPHYKPPFTQKSLELIFLSLLLSQYIISFSLLSSSLWILCGSFLSSWFCSSLVSPSPQLWHSHNRHNHHLAVTCRHHLTATSLLVLLLLLLQALISLRLLIIPLPSIFLDQIALILLSFPKFPMITMRIQISQGLYSGK